MVICRVLVEDWCLFLNFKGTTGLYSLFDRFSCFEGCVSVEVRGRDHKAGIPSNESTWTRAKIKIYVF